MFNAEQNLKRFRTEYSAGDEAMGKLNKVDEILRHNFGYIEEVQHQRPSDWGLFFLGFAKTATGNAQSNYDNVDERNKYINRALIQTGKCELRLKTIR